MKRRDQQTMTDLDEKKPKRRSSFVALLPVILFGLLAVLFLFRIDSGDPSKVPSALIGSPVPEFDLPPLEGLVSDGNAVPGFSSASLREGSVTLVNVWASWCGPCREEHPFLVELAKDERFSLVGLNYKDAADNARRFLGQFGNPYTAVGTDNNGRVGIDWGVYGVPETFVVGRDGKIAYKHVGPISEKSLTEQLLPEIEKALAAGS